MEFLEPIKVKSQDTTFALGFRLTRENFKYVIARRREKRRARATGQTVETPLKIPHLSVTFSTPHYSYRSQLSTQTSMDKKPE